MQSITHALFCLYLQDKKNFLPTAEQVSAQLELDGLLQQLKDGSPERRRQLLRIRDLSGNLHDFDEENAFAYGVGNGIRLMTEWQGVYDACHPLSEGDTEQAIFK